MLVMRVSPTPPSCQPAQPVPTHTLVQLTFAWNLKNARSLHLKALRDGDDTGTIDGRAHKYAEGVQSHGMTKQRSWKDPSSWGVRSKQGGGKAGTQTQAAETEFRM